MHDIFFPASEGFILPRGSAFSDNMSYMSNLFQLSVHIDLVQKQLLTQKSNHKCVPTLLKDLEFEAAVKKTQHAIQLCKYITLMVDR